MERRSCIAILFLITSVNPTSKSAIVCFWEKVKLYRNSNSHATDRFSRFDTNAKVKKYSFSIVE